VTEHQAHHLGEDLGAMAEGGARLLPERKAELEAHVKSCIVCKSAIEECKKLYAALEGLPLVEPSPAFDRALFAKLDEIDRVKEASLTERLRAFFTVPRFALAGGAVAAAVIAVILTRPGGEDPNTHEELARGEAAALVESGEDAIELAENLDLLKDLDAIENLDVIDDLEVIAEAGEEKEPG
jgi:catechol 2,3-dioxygenase-like lactoylglutathione lyase family enzyme